MRSVIAAVLVAVIVTVGALAGYFVGSTNQHTSTVTTTIFTTNQHFATPVPANFYVNGQEASGTMCFNVPTRSQVWNVTANYPWRIQNGTAYPPPVGVGYTFAPFPLGGTIPTWLHLSMQPPYVVLADGQNSTASFRMTLDSTVQNGQMARFALHAYYTDPMSGSSVVNVITLGLVVNGSSTTLHDCSHSSA
jgi:hypothetical protein